MGVESIWCGVLAVAAVVVFLVKPRVIAWGEGKCKGGDCVLPVVGVVLIQQLGDALKQSGQMVACDFPD